MNKKKCYYLLLAMIILIFLISNSCSPPSNSSSDGGGSSDDSGAGAPYITSSNPADNSTDIDPEINFVAITFNEDMADGESLSINVNIDVDTQWIDSKNYQIDLLEPLRSNMLIEFKLNPSGYPLKFKNISDVPLGTDTTISFTTGDDTTAPNITNSNPSDGAVNVDKSIMSVTINFDDYMKDGYSYTQDLGVVNNIQWNDEKTLQIDFEDSLKANTTYTITLNPSGYPLSFKNISDVPLGTDTTISFTTGD